MSDEAGDLGESTEIHYIYSDDGYLLDQNNVSTDIGDIIYDDNNRIFIVDGQYLITDGNQTILLEQPPENEPQYFLNSETDESFIINSDQLLENSQMVQLIEENAPDDSQPIILYTNDSDDNKFAAIESIPHLLNIENIQDEDGNIYPIKRIKLEDSSLFTTQITEEEPPETEEYIIEPIRHESGELDLDKITGKNLITGQTVTLHSYMEKLKKKLKTDDISSLMVKKDAKTSDLIDRKIPIGLTKTGKKIVGKIVHIGRKQAEKNDEPTYLKVSQQPVTKDGYDEINKTLAGVMQMNSVRKKLANRNIIVKLVERKYCSETDAFTKSTNYAQGYMQRQNDDGHEKWAFIQDSKKFEATSNITIVVTYTKNAKKSIKVNLNPSNGNICSICSQHFKSNLQLRLHMSAVHNTIEKTSNCDVCHESFDDFELFSAHKRQHIADGKLFACGECKKTFTTSNRLEKHVKVHNVDAKQLICGVCDVRCGSEFALKKHLMAHAGIKPFKCDVCGKQFSNQYDVNAHRKVHFSEKLFTCNVCMRGFSRHSNLLRHSEIHKGSGELFKCGICDCSYNFISSLTRHMVQNHINSADLTLIQPSEDECS